MEVMEIMRSITFEAGHWLPNVAPSHKCANPHGHTYTVKVWCRGTLDPATGWVYDFSDLDTQLAVLRDTLDHSTLNHVPGLENPTAENMALLVARSVKLGGYPPCAVEIHEGAHGVVRYVPSARAS